MSNSKILETKIKSNTIEDILENPELFYQMILEFHQMNIDEKQHGDLFQSVLIKQACLQITQQDVVGKVFQNNS